jgi:hypothetical protein
MSCRPQHFYSGWNRSHAKIGCSATSQGTIHSSPAMHHRRLGWFGSRGECLPRAGLREQSPLIDGYCGASCAGCETKSQRRYFFSKTSVTKFVVTREVPSVSLASPIFRPAVQATFPLTCTCVSSGLAMN